MHKEKDGVVHEVQNLAKNVEHIKEIVAMQQSYAKVAWVMEDLSASTLVEDALRMNEDALRKDGITVKRDFAEVPLVRADKHKVMQILVNLFCNSRDALHASGRTDKLVLVSIRANGAGQVKISTHDNGIGIAADNLTRVFSHGFTTKKEGHGFGLHSGALAAKEMGGSLQAFSDGPGKGATFVLELPIAAQVGK
jgi:C4-dicarboxylate-specific signal transduction histidine kinase